MRASVYRNLDGQSTLLGLAFPGEALFVLTAFFALMATLPAGGAGPRGAARDVARGRRGPGPAPP